MKTLLFGGLLGFLFLTPNISFSQLGIIYTEDGSEIELFPAPRTKKGKRFKEIKIPEDCDCNINDNDFVFYNKNNEIIKLSNDEIKKITMLKGTTYCKIVESSYGNQTSRYTNKVEIPLDFTFLSLPYMKGKSRKFLFAPMLQNDQFLVAYCLTRDGKNYTTIYNKDQNNEAMDTCEYMSVGFGKQGQSFLKKLKTCFKDCPEVLAEIERKEKHNEKAKRFKKEAILLGLENFSCE